MSVVNQLMRKVRLACGLCLVKLMDDARQIQQVQVTVLNGEVRSNVNRYQNYGFTSVPLEGAEAIAFAVGANRNHLVVVACDDGRHRKKDLTAGEVSLYTDEGDYVLFKRGRIIEVVAGTKVKITAPVLEVVASSQVTFTSPAVTMSGTLSVVGNISTQAAISAQGDITGQGSIASQGNITSQATITGGQVRSAAGRDLDTLRVTGVQGGPDISGTPV